MTEADLDQSQKSLQIAASTDEPPVPVQASLSIGQALAEKRLSLKLTIDDVSTRIKYSVRFIQALESDHWDDLPSGLALRGLIKSYTRLLGVDSQEAESALKERIGVIHGGIANHTSTRSLATHETDRSQQSSVGWLLLIGIVVVAAIVIAISQGVIPKALLPQWIGAFVK